jgi:large subunit ribosomal protein L20
MPRVKKGAARHRTKKRILKAIEGHRGATRTNYRLAKEALVRAGVYARAGRKQRKRQFRGLWITRLSAACKARGLRYSQMIHGMKKANITINRKMLSEIAIADPPAFDLIVNAVKAVIA